VCARYVWSKHEKYPVNVVCLLYSGVGTVYGVRFLIPVGGCDSWCVYLLSCPLVALLRLYPPTTSTTVPRADARSPRASGRPWVRTTVPTVIILNCANSLEPRTKGPTKKPNSLLSSLDFSHTRTFWLAVRKDRYIGIRLAVRTGGHPPVDPRLRVASPSRLRTMMCTGATSCGRGRTPGSSRA